MNSHQGSSHKLVLQGLLAAGVTDAVYMACAIGSGIREFELMAAVRVFDRDALRVTHRQRWLEEVLRPNVVAARAVACHVRRKWDVPVIDPTHFDVAEFSQADYDALCKQVISAHTRAVALAPGWQYSRGARAEVRLALGFGMPIFTTDGNPLADEHISELAEEADHAVAAMGVISPPGRPLLLPSLSEAAV